jgi:hypothetical protein
LELRVLDKTNMEYVYYSIKIPWIRHKKHKDTTKHTFITLVYEYEMHQHNVKDALWYI